MKDNNNIIKKITIEIGGVEVGVTPEQALNLHEALGELLGLNKDPIVIKNTEYIPYYPFRWPYTQPFWCSTSNTTGNYPEDKYKIQYSQTTGEVKLNV